MRSERRWRCNQQAPPSGGILPPTGQNATLPGGAVPCWGKANRCCVVRSGKHAWLSIRAHSFRRKICRINARNHLVRLSALATSYPFALLKTSQYESGARA
jgi:hypothetical protein